MYGNVNLCAECVQGVEEVDDPGWVACLVDHCLLQFRASEKDLFFLMEEGAPC